MWVCPRGFGAAARRSMGRPLGWGWEWVQRGPGKLRDPLHLVASFALLMLLLLLRMLPPRVRLRLRSPQGLPVVAQSLVREGLQRMDRWARRAATRGALEQQGLVQGAAAVWVDRRGFWQMHAGAGGWFLCGMKLFFLNWISEKK